MPAKKSLFMGSTEVPAERSAMSILSLLQAAGAKSVNMRYSETRDLCGIDFVFAVSVTGAMLEFPFAIPARVEVLVNHMVSQRKHLSVREKAAITAKAKRVAWRQLFRWVEAQIALVDTGMVSVAEVFTPYCIDRSGRTVFEVLMDNRLKMLPAPGGAQ